MKEVTQAEFFAVMSPLDVHPSNRLPDRTDWELRNRTIVGMSLPGWRNPGEPERYFLNNVAT